ncbi:biotin transporter BioY [Roseinatronobacter sp.]|uniref:biotin transporter BioY n=1 Tax=Roseinatronobacter sp. TaxID=1945755 RepID=UPI0025EA5076|nr:biotin transporter BioY [Roseibaca sp.]
MPIPYSRSPALIGALPTPQDQRLRLLRSALLVLAGTMFIALSARIQVPMWPVPMTMQTFAVLLVGMAFGARLAGATLLAYLAQGAMGLPVFAGGGGVLFLTGPTAGYLVGFLGAAVLVGWLADRGWTAGYVRSFCAACLGGALIHAVGAAWLSAFIGVSGALAAGVAPFLAGDLLKSVLVALLLPNAWALLNK